MPRTTTPYSTCRQLKQRRKSVSKTIGFGLKGQIDCAKELLRHTASGGQNAGQVN